MEWQLKMSNYIVMFVFSKILQDIMNRLTLEDKSANLCQYGQCIQSSKQNTSCSYYAVNRTNFTLYDLKSRTKKMNFSTKRNHSCSQLVHL